MKLSDWIKDLPSSLVVFVVAVPLSLGIALASGTSPASGLIAAAVGGLVVGALSGAPLMVSGPAAGLTVLVFQIVQDVGIAGLAIATLIGGLIQVVMSLLKTGWIFKRFPSAILNGMLAAIGLIILLGQVHVLFGQKVPNSPVDSLIGIPSSALTMFADGGIAPVVWVSLVALGTLIGWPKVAKKVKALSWIPAALPAVIFATLVSLPLAVDRIQIGSLFATIGDHFSSTLGAVATLEWAKVFVAGLGIAIVASAESLLTARAAGILKRERDHKLNQEHVPMQENLDRELMAQGLGNAASGALGGLPITGVIVRTAANIDANGNTRASTMLHGVWVALFVLALPVVLNQIPFAALAAVLVMTGIKLLNVGGLLKAIKTDRAQGVLWALTIGAIVFTNLLAGLGIALGVAIAMNWKGMIHWVKRARELQRLKQVRATHGRLSEASRVRVAPSKIKSGAA